MADVCVSAECPSSYYYYYQQHSVLYRSYAFPITQPSVVAEAYKCAGLVINTKKTEVLIQESNTYNTTHPSFSVAGNTANSVSHFTYLGSILTIECDISADVQHCQARLSCLRPSFSACLFQP